MTDKIRQDPARGVPPIPQYAAQWQEAVSRWRGKGWTVTRGDFTTEVTDITRDGCPCRIGIGYYDKRFYLLAAYDEDTAFARSLRQDLGGKTNYWTWWNYLPDPYRDMPFGKFNGTLLSDDRFQQYVTVLVEHIQGAALRHHRTFTRISGVELPPGWTCCVLHYDTAVCELKGSDGNWLCRLEAAPLSSDETAALDLALPRRAGCIDVIKSLLGQLGRLDLAADIDRSRCRVTVREIQACTDDAREALSAWMQMLSGVMKE